MNQLKQLLALCLLTSTLVFADSAREIEADSNAALAEFYAESNGAKEYLDKAKAYLVFPNITEAGFFFGGNYGEGVLRVKDETKGYYSMSTASVGFQMGMQKYSMVIAFTSDAALNKFLQNDDEWEADIDVHVSFADWNSDEESDSFEIDNSMIAFVFDSTGFMGSFTMKGTKFEKLHK